MANGSRFSRRRHGDPDDRGSAALTGKPCIRIPGLSRSLRKPAVCTLLEVVSQQTDTTGTADIFQFGSPARLRGTSDDRRVEVIVTGGNSGVGEATAAALAAAGHSVVIACRTMPKAERAAAAMTGDVTVAHLDLADLASVRKFADSVDGVDV